MRRIKAMTFGLGGNMGYFDSKHRETTSWYVRPEHLQACIDAGHYGKEEMEGCILIDLRQAVEKNPMLVFHEPLLDVRLQDGETERFADLAENVTPGLVEAVTSHSPVLAHCVAQAEKSEEYRGLDTVSLPAFVQWWRDHGAVFGVVQDGIVKWEDAE